ncbi:hypothetical protein H257_09562 [Aphanomyces astaci]|uniref:Uncharacterized protein n=1 Tax=Aphanomyces astaci TaxID=112090 RepID=W4GCA9_APHAT|nr:hypothetical protein H257_09562 [Aphanomyces astaci]ETV76563.1 hypothetical protein H257_09562 [Aphanomyces astaci]|eukprot:XP_009834108.1 hypothetical protein H257_09562 [Aphanomyces astaci]
MAHALQRKTATCQWPAVQRVFERSAVGSRLGRSSSLPPYAHTEPETDATKEVLHDDAVRSHSSVAVKVGAVKGSPAQAASLGGWHESCATDPHTPSPREQPT